MTLDSEQQLAADTITDCYRILAQQNTNIVLELMKGHDELIQWQHYPQKSVQNHIAQFYYHCHDRKDSEDSVHEHGHFHCFLRKPQKLTKAEPLRISDKHLADPKKDNLCHMIGIAVNEYAQPTALFTTNHWVTHGFWYPADVMCELLELYEIETDEPYNTVSRWVSAMFKLFKPQIKELFHHRDQVIAEWQQENPDVDVFKDKKLEVTSIFSFT